MTSKNLNIEAFRKWKAGEITEVEYQNELAKTKGFVDRNAEFKDMYKRQGFTTRKEYKTHLAKKLGFPDLKSYEDSLAQRRGYKNNLDLAKQRHKINNILKGKPADMSENKNCSLWLGYVMGERILSKVFKDVQRMSTNHPGYDFICNKNKKIDVKTSCLHKNTGWNFDIDNNIVPDYFLCLAFDNRKDMNPLHIWLIKGDEIIRGKTLNTLRGLWISKNRGFMYKFDKFELTDKLDKVIDCCDTLKDK